MKYLTQRISNYDNVYMVSVAITRDSENNYAEKDQIHPTKAGYEQIANVVYSTLCAHMN